MQSVIVVFGVIIVKQCQQILHQNFVPLNLIVTRIRRTFRLTIKTFMLRAHNKN